MNKIKEVVNTRTKKIIVGVVGIIIVIGCGSIVYLMTKDSTPTLKVKKSSITIEYGDSVSLDSKEYLDTKKIVKEEQEKYIKEVKIESDIKNEEGKEYPAIGKYEITLKYEKQTAKVKVEVKDTTKPTFNEVNEVSFEEGTEYDYAANITATDLQEVEVTFDTSGVNKDVVGEYTVKAIAKDASGNEVTKDIKVIVTAKAKVNEENNVDTGTSSNTNATNNGDNASTPNTNNGSASSNGASTSNASNSNASSGAASGGNGSSGNSASNANSSSTNNGSATGSTDSSSQQPKFVLPSDTQKEKFFMTWEEAEAYAKKNNIRNFEILETYDWKTDTHYCVVLLS